MRMIIAISMIPLLPFQKDTKSYFCNKRSLKVESQKGIMSWNIRQDFILIQAWEGASWRRLFASCISQKERERNGYHDHHDDGEKGGGDDRRFRDPQKLSVRSALAVLGIIRITMIIITLLVFLSLKLLLSLSVWEMKIKNKLSAEATWSCHDVMGRTTRDSFSSSSSSQIKNAIFSDHLLYFSCSCSLFFFYLPLPLFSWSIPWIRPSLHSIKPSIW